MAERNYLVEGLSGAGKSSVYEELIGRGYKAISTDRAWKYRPRHSDSSMWDEQRAVSELESPEPDVLFVCGSSGNRDRFLPYFTKVFNLRIDDDTMRRRLQERTNNEFGKQPEELELMLKLNRSGEKPAGAMDIDASRPLDHVVDEVLRLADCRPVASDSTLPPWSKRGSAIGRSLLIPESALLQLNARGTAAELWDVLGRETIARIEYSWSGDVLSTLLPYLDDQGIDLVRSDHEELASALSQTRQGRVLVLTQITVSVIWRASIQVRSTAQRFAATTRSSTRRRQRASVTQCWTGLRSFATRSRLSKPRSWPCSSSDVPAQATCARRWQRPGIPPDGGDGSLGCQPC